MGDVGPSGSGTTDSGTMNPYFELLEHAVLQPEPELP